MTKREKFYKHLNGIFKNGIPWLDEDVKIPPEFGDIMSRSKDEKKRCESNDYYLSKKIFKNKEVQVILNKLEVNLDSPCLNRYRCVGSSARFVLCALHQIKDNIKNLKFERVLVAGIIRPHLDAIFNHKDTTYYVEGKCAEIYEKPSFKVKKSYLGSGEFKHFLESLYSLNTQVFNGKSVKEFMVSLNEKSKNDEFDLLPYDLGLKGDFKRFDFKQFICHIIGIVYGNKLDTNNKALVYLYYDDKWEEGAGDINVFVEEFEIIRSYFKPFLDKNKIKLLIAQHDKFNHIENGIEGFVEILK